MLPFTRKLFFIVLLVGSVFHLSYAEKKEATQKELIPLDISANDGIEIFDNEQHIVAKGNVVAERGDSLMFAALCHAYYTPGNERKIERLHAIQNVLLVGPEGTLYADEGHYNLSNDTLIFTGEKLHFYGYEGHLFARDKLVYQPKQGIAEAFGDVRIHHLDDKLTADYVKAFFKEKPEESSKNVEANKGQQKQLSLERIEAKGHVILVQPLRTVWCDEASYEAPKEFLICRGNARIQDKDGIAEGHYAEVDRKTGISKLLSNKEAGAKSPKARIRALIMQE